MLLPETETFPHCAIHPGREERNEGHLEGAGIRMGPTCEDSKMAEYNWMWFPIRREEDYHQGGTTGGRGEDRF